MEEKKNTLSWSDPHKAAPTVSVPASSPVPPMPKSPLPSQNMISVSESNTKMPIYLGGAVVLLVVVVFGVWAYNSPKDTTPVPAKVATTTTTTDTESQTAVATGPLVVETQYAGMSVAVAHVEVSSPTWVAVYESSNGKPGNILGAALFLTSTENGTVELLRATRADQEYLVGEFTDNGDRVFSLKADAPVSNAAGNPILVPFKVQ